MNIYNAILKAADWIEKYPKLFDYQETDVPHECGSKGCAVGWIAYFCKVKPMGNDLDAMCKAAIGVSYWGKFVARMDRLEGLESYWRGRANDCARVLRLYAEKYHAPSITGIPDSVRAIFSEDLKAAPDSLADMAGAPSVGR